MKRPKVLIPEIKQDVSNYTNAMYAAGMDPLVVSVQSFHLTHSFQREYIDYADVRAQSFDGLLLPGGGDINPEAYGEQNHGSIPVEKWIDRLQFSLLEDFLRLRRPVFGICRGLQLINVLLGGTLIQDLEDAPMHRCLPDRHDQVHACQAVAGSWLCGLYGESFFHNSSHHQAVHRLGEGLIVDSRCPFDGVVESLHHADLPVYAVQWHPERMCLAHERSDTVNGLKVFSFFCKLLGGVPDADDPYRDHPFRRDGIVSEGLSL